MKANLRERIKSDKESMQNLKMLGEKKGKQLCEEVSNFFMRESNEHARESIEKILFEVIKNPEDLIEEAFARSFSSKDYVAAYKYVRDVVKYCIEVSEQMTREKINTEILVENNQLRGKINSFYEKISTFNSTDFTTRPGQQYSVYSLFGEIADYLDKTKLKGDCIRDSIKSIMDANIDNIDCFMDSFRESFGREMIENQSELIENRVNELKKYAESHRSSLLKKFLGCQARCPGCGSKCNKDSEHKDPHSSKKHIYNGFNGWANKDTHVVSMQICWEKSFFLDSRIFIGLNPEIIYNNLKEYLTQKYPDWLKDIEDNFIKYGQNQIGDFICFILFFNL